MPLLKRTDTLTGTDPLRKCRAASIAGARRVTSGCHLHYSEPQDQRDRNTPEWGAQEVRHSSRIQRRVQAPPRLRATHSAPPIKVARAYRPEIYSRTWPSGRCSPAFPDSPFLEISFLSLVNKAHMSPSAESQVFHFLQTAFSGHQLYARMEAGERISWDTGGSS